MRQKSTCVETVEVAAALDERFGFDLAWRYSDSRHRAGVRHDIAAAGPPAGAFIL